MHAEIEVTKSNPVVASTSSTPQESLRISNRPVTRFLDRIPMSQDNVRLTRLLRECDVRAGPFIFLAAAIPVLVLLLMLF